MAAKPKPPPGPATGSHARPRPPPQQVARCRLASALLAKRLSRLHKKRTRQREGPGPTRAPGTSCTWPCSSKHSRLASLLDIPELTQVCTAAGLRAASGRAHPKPVSRPHYLRQRLLDAPLQLCPARPPASTTDGSFRSTGSYTTSRTASAVSPPLSSAKRRASTAAVLAPDTVPSICAFTGHGQEAHGGLAANHFDIASRDIHT